MALNSALKCFKVIMLAAWLTFLGHLSFANPISENELSLFSKSSPHFIQENVESWLNQTLKILNEEGVTLEKVKVVSLSSWIVLWNMSDLERKDPDFHRLKQNISYWKMTLGLNQLNEFIQNTNNSSPYQLLSIHLESWVQMTKFMVEVGFFDVEPQSPRSLQSFFMSTYWAEGAETSRKSKPELWINWQILFSQIPGLVETIKHNFDLSFFGHEGNKDFIQRVYITFNSNLFRVISKYPKLIGPDFLTELLDPDVSLLYASQTDLLDDVLMQINVLIRVKTKIDGKPLTLKTVKPLVKYIVRDTFNNNIWSNSASHIEAQIIKSISKRHPLLNQRSCNKFIGLIN